MSLNLLIVEDDKKIRESLTLIFNKQTFAGFEIIATPVETFEAGIEMIKTVDFDIVILDLFKDQSNGAPTDENAGIKVLEAIRKCIFVPVVFYTGHAHKIKDLVSEVVGVVSKGDGVAILVREVERIINSKLALLKKNIHQHVNEQLRDYFWETIDTEKELFIPQKNDFSLGYLLLRRIANSLSKENIKSLLGDEKINKDKAHPMEFYIYPCERGEYQVAEILQDGENYYVILTPSCDLVLRSNGKRKTERVLLASADKFNNLQDVSTYQILKKKEKRTKEENSQLANLEEKIKNWIGNNRGEKDRYFFLPFTPFIDNRVIDFQNNIMIDYDDLKKYKRIAQLDSPFAQSMTASFLRYYNRIGFPDIDAEYIISVM